MLYKIINRFIIDCAPFKRPPPLVRQYASHDLIQQLNLNLNKNKNHEFNICGLFKSNSNSQNHSIPQNNLISLV